MQQQADEEELGLSDAALEALKEFALENNLGELCRFRCLSCTGHFFFFLCWTCSSMTSRCSIVAMQIRLIFHACQPHFELLHYCARYVIVILYLLKYELI